jgi:hypothetical protein
MQLLIWPSLSECGFFYSYKQSDQPTSRLLFCQLEDEDQEDVDGTSSVETSKDNDDLDVEHQCDLGVISVRVDCPQLVAELPEELLEQLETSDDPTADLRDEEFVAHATSEDVGAHLSVVLCLEAPNDQNAQSPFDWLHDTISNAVEFMFYGFHGRVLSVVDRDLIEEERINIRRQNLTLVLNQHLQSLPSVVCRVILRYETEPPLFHAALNS